jgi:DNA end-binding protein Ku
VWSIAVVPRAHWKGFLKLSLVSCPIALYPAIAKAERISFRQVNRHTGNRLRQQLVDAVTGEAVASGQKALGYELGENQFLVLSDQELEEADQEARRRPYSQPPAITADEGDQPAEKPPAGPLRPYSPSASTSAVAAKALPEPPSVGSPTTSADFDDLIPRPIENNRTIEIDRFIPRAQVDARYLDTPYYVVPRDQIGEEAFAVVRDAMRRQDVVGMGRVVLARRERPIILEPMADGIRGTTLRYNHEIRDEQVYFAAIPQLKLPQEMLRVAQHIIETKTADFDPKFLEDRYRTVLISKLKDKHAELPKKLVPSKPPAENVVSLMDVLKRSLAAERLSAGSPTQRASSRRIGGSAPKRAKARKAG